MIELNCQSLDGIAETILQLECLFADDAMCQRYSCAALVYCHALLDDIETHEYAYMDERYIKRGWWGYSPTVDTNTVPEKFRIRFDLTQEGDREMLREVVRNIDAIASRHGRINCKLRLYAHYKRI